MTDAAVRQRRWRRRQRLGLDLVGPFELDVGLTAQFLVDAGDLDPRDMSAEAITRGLQRYLEKNVTALRTTARKP